jgi:hypothetical protein
MDSLLVVAKWLGSVKGYMLHISRLIGTRHPSAIVPPSSSPASITTTLEDCPRSEACFTHKEHHQHPPISDMTKGTPKPASKEPLRHRNRPYSTFIVITIPIRCRLVLSCCWLVSFDDRVHVIYIIELLTQSFSMIISRHTKKLDGRRDEHHSTPTPKRQPSQKNLLCIRRKHRKMLMLISIYQKEME